MTDRTCSICWLQLCSYSSTYYKYGCAVCHTRVCIHSLTLKIEIISSCHTCWSQFSYRLRSLCNFSLLYLCLLPCDRTKQVCFKSHQHPEGSQKLMKSYKIGLSTAKNSHVMISDDVTEHYRHQEMSKKNAHGISHIRKIGAPVFG